MQYPFNYFHWKKEIPIKQYLQPHSIPEALEILSYYNGRAQVIAGGTDVIPQIRRGELNIDVLVDITCIPDMNYIEMDGKTICLGGMVTHAQVCLSHLIRNRAKLLAQAAETLGSPQIRNVATIAGNLVSGQPAADIALPLLTLNANVTILSKSGQREVPLNQFFLDQGKTVLDCHREILTQIRFFALQKNQGSYYLRLSKRKALSLPILAVAIKVTADPEKKLFMDAAIALGPVAPIPYRAMASEDYLRNASICKETIDMAAQYASDESNPRSSLLRGSREYRKEMIKVLVRRALIRAIEDIGISLTEGIRYE